MIRSMEYALSQSDGEDAMLRFLEICVQVYGVQAYYYVKGPRKTKV